MGFLDETGLARVWSKVKANVTDIWDKLGTATLDTDADNVSDAINEHEGDISQLNSSLQYKAGDYFSARAWKAIGRVINSGMGVFVTIYFAKPITATGATINIGSVNIYGITNSAYNGTISNVSISGNELSFVLGTTASNPAGTLVLAEFYTTAITLT